MKKEMKEWVLAEFPEKAEYIIKHALSEKKLQQIGVDLYENEIFVKYPGWNFWGSNYGRAVTLVEYSPTNKRLRLRAETVDPGGHVIYIFTKPSKRKNGVIVSEPKSLAISGQRIVSDLFLPTSFWEGLKRNQMQGHHLHKNEKANNCWKWLIALPAWLHRPLEYTDSQWLYDGEQFVQLHPYEIAKRTGLTLDELILPVMRKCDVVTWEDGHRLEVYCIGGHYIGYELEDIEFREKLEAKMLKAKQARKKKSKKKKSAGA